MDPCDVTVASWLIRVHFRVPCRFDLLANGGASLTLSFERAPFLTQYRTVWVPWNVFYVMDTLVMKKVRSPPLVRWAGVTSFPVTDPRVTSRCSRRRMRFRAAT